MNKELRTIRVLLLAGLLGCTCIAYAQEQPAESIKVTKVEQLVKAEYDNTQYKLVGIDRFGNPKLSAVRSFELHYNLNGNLYKYVSYSSGLTPEMLESLKKLKIAQKIFFTKIKAEDDNGHLVELPDLIEMHFPDCPKNKKKKK